MVVPVVKAGLSENAGNPVTCRVDLRLVVGDDPGSELELLSGRVDTQKGAIQRQRLQWWRWVDIDLQSGGTIERGQLGGVLVSVHSIEVFGRVVKKQ